MLVELLSVLHRVLLTAELATQLDAIQVGLEHNYN